MPPHRHNSTSHLEPDARDAPGTGAARARRETQQLASYTGPRSARRRNPRPHPARAQPETAPRLALGARLAARTCRVESASLVQSRALHDAAELLQRDLSVAIEVELVDHCLRRRGSRHRRATRCGRAGGRRQGRGEARACSSSSVRFSPSSLAILRMFRSDIFPLESSSKSSKAFFISSSGERIAMRCDMISRNCTRGRGGLCHERGAAASAGGPGSSFGAAASS